MGFFGKSFEEKVEEALEAMRKTGGVENLAADIDDEVVTLTGVARNVDVKGKLMRIFNNMVETKNTINRLDIAEAPAPAAPEPVVEESTPQVSEDMVETVGFGAKATHASAPSPAAAPEPAAPAAEAGAGGGETIYEVVSGDTLGAIAKAHYGKASAYMKIFEANRDQLDNPDRIKVGQRLRIPE